MARHYKSAASKKRAMKGFYGRKYGGYYSQKGKSNEAVDKKRRAKRVGWRRNKKGRYYFERRRNRSDHPKSKV